MEAEFERWRSDQQIIQDDTSSIEVNLSLGKNKTSKQNEWNNHENTAVHVKIKPWMINHCITETDMEKSTTYETSSKRETEPGFVPWCHRILDVPMILAACSRLSRPSELLLGTEAHGQQHRVSEVEFDQNRKV
jgi:hypothetical protein